jgi:outer membrane protein assembly factor BamB
MRLLLLFSVAAGLAAQTDWPQFGGPNRNFMVPDAALAAAWPAAGPKVLWTRPLGDGYSAISVAGAVAFTMFKRGDEDITTALDARTGKTLWEYATSRKTDRSLDLGPGPGPHSTPLITGGRVFAVNTVGILHALDAKTGKPAWSHDLWREFKGAQQDRGYAASPLAWKDTIILPVGGSSGQSLMAFRQNDGSVAWKAGSIGGTFSSPMLIDMSGLTQLVVFSGKAVAGFNPDNGDPQWSFPHSTDYDLNISMPVWGPDNILFISSAYSGGSAAIQLTREGLQTKAKELWAHKRMRIHHNNAIRIGDLVFGSSGDFGPAPLTAVNVKDGKVVWQDRALGKCSLIQAGSQTILASEDGEIALANLSPTGLKIVSRTTLLRHNAWTAPALAGGVMYFRDRHTAGAVSLKPQGVQ